MSDKPPIQMPNRKLAEGMITAGCAFAPQEENGPCLNVYTPAMLRARRIIGINPISAEEFERQVLNTAETKRSGEVVYFFERSNDAENFVKAWDEMSDLIRAHAEYDAMSDADKAATDKPRAIPNIPVEIIAQVLCVHANNGLKFKRYPFINAPVCNTLQGGYTEPREGSKTCSTGVQAGETRGGGKVWSTDLNNEDRANIKLGHKKLKNWQDPYGKR